GAVLHLPERPIPHPLEGDELREQRVHLELQRGVADGSGPQLARLLGDALALVFRRLSIDAEEVLFVEDLETGDAFVEVVQLLRILLLRELLCPGRRGHEGILPHAATGTETEEALLFWVT